MFNASVYKLSSQTAPKDFQLTPTAAEWRPNWKQNACVFNACWPATKASRNASWLLKRRCKAAAVPWQGHACAFPVWRGVWFAVVGAIRGSGVNRKGLHTDWSDSWLPRELEGFAARACETIRRSRNSDVKHPPCFGRDIHLRFPSWRWECLLAGARRRSNLTA